jgi:hypothetical protein
MQASVQPNQGASYTIQTLKTLVAARFGATRERKHIPPLPTGITAWDAAGGLRQGQLTEICGDAGDGALLLSQILEQAFQNSWTGAIIDAASTLEPEEWPPHYLQNILWVRCNSTAQAIRATDLLLRDGNCLLLALDLHGSNSRDLTAIPTSTWHRFHRILDHSNAALLVFSPTPLAEGAMQRIAADSEWTLHDLSQMRIKLYSKACTRVFQRGSTPTLHPNPSGAAA